MSEALKEKITDTEDDLNFEAQKLADLALGNEKHEYTVCFVCTGNTCRCPMAAAVTNYISQNSEKSIGTRFASDSEQNIVWKAISAGISPNPGEPISEGAKLALREAGILSTAENPWEMHRAERISDTIMKKSDIVVAISGQHALLLMACYPEYAGKIYAMPHDIPDPFGGDTVQYRECLNKIKNGIEELFGV